MKRIIEFNNDFVEAGNIHFGLRNENQILTLETSLHKPLELGDVLKMQSPLLAQDGFAAAFEVVEITKSKESENPKTKGNTFQKVHLKIVSSREN